MNRELILSLISSMLISLLLSPIIIMYLRKFKLRQTILGYVEDHKLKAGTPTMGGIIFILVGLIIYLIFIDSSYTMSTMCMLAFFGFGLIGFIDDFIKVYRHQNEGLKPWQKLLLQTIIATAFAIYAYFDPKISGGIIIPFYGEINIDFWIIPIIIFLFLATTNSVNLTDGLDGLAGSVSSIFILAYVIIVSFCILPKSNVDIALELNNVNILAFGVLGGIFGFLIQNSYPAKVFMGDCGSLALGGLITAICVVSKMYLLLPIVGIMFVVSSMSVIIQVISYKTRGKRVFLMAPYHHHLQIRGYSETKVSMIYVFVTILFSCIALMLFI